MYWHFMPFRMHDIFQNFMNLHTSLPTEFLICLQLSLKKYTTFHAWGMQYALKHAIVVNKTICLSIN